MSGASTLLERVLIILPKSGKASLLSRISCDFLVKPYPHLKMRSRLTIG